MSVESGGAVRGEGLAFADIPGMAITVHAGEANLSDVSVRASGNGFGTESAAMRVRGGGFLGLNGAQIEGARLHGLLALDEGTRVDLQDVVIRDTRHLGAQRDERRAGDGAGSGSDSAHAGT